MGSHHDDKITMTRVVMFTRRQPSPLSRLMLILWYGAGWSLPEDSSPQVRPHSSHGGGGVQHKREVGRSTNLMVMIIIFITIVVVIAIIITIVVIIIIVIGEVVLSTSGNT